MLPPLASPRHLARRAHRVGTLLRQTDLDAIERRVWDRYEALNDRRARRAQRRSQAAPQPRCSVCHCFKTNRNAPCSHCGFDPVVGWRQ